MAAPSDKRIIMPSDMLYFLTFGLGMAAFWISGHASALLPKFPNATMATVAGMSVTAAIFGLGMLILAYAVTRKLKPTLIATLVSVILGLITAQVIVQVGGRYVKNYQDLGILTFVLFLCYGFIYVASLAIGRRIAK